MQFCARPKNIEEAKEEQTDPYKNYRVITVNGFYGFEYYVKKRFFFGLLVKRLFYWANDHTKRYFFNTKEEAFTFVERDNSLNKGVVDKSFGVMHIGNQQEGSKEKNNLISFPILDPQNF